MLLAKSRAGLWGNRTSPSEVAIYHLNISTWGRPVERLMEARSSELGLFAFSEHHLHAVDKLGEAKKAISRLHLRSLFHPAVPADDISKHSVGTREWYDAPHAGVF